MGPLCQNLKLRVETEAVLNFTDSSQHGFINRLTNAVTGNALAGVPVGASKDVPDLMHENLLQVGRPHRAVQPNDGVVPRLSTGVSQTSIRDLVSGNHAHFVLAACNGLQSKTRGCVQTRKGGGSRSAKAGMGVQLKRDGGCEQLHLSVPQLRPFDRALAASDQEQSGECNHDMSHEVQLSCLEKGVKG